MRAAFLLLAISSVASAIRHAGISGQVALRRKSKSNLESGGYFDDVGDDIAKGAEAVAGAVKDVAVDDYDTVKSAAVKIGHWVKKQFGKCHLCSDLGTVLGDGIQAFILDDTGAGEAESGTFATALGVLKASGQGIGEAAVCSAASNDVVKPVLEAIDNITIAGINLSFNGSAAASCFSDVCAEVWGGIEDTLGQDLSGVLVSMITSAFCGCSLEFSGCVEMFESGDANFQQLKSMYQALPAPTADNPGKYVTQNCERKYAGKEYAPCGCSGACLNMYGPNEGAGVCRQGCNGAVPCSEPGCGCAPECVAQNAGLCPESCGKTIWMVDA